jgi:hypothetical protein
MAAAHRTLKARPGRNRSSTSSTKHRQSRPRSGAPPIDREALRDGLKSHIRTMRNAMYVVIVCCEASRMQNADHDTEISTTLRLYGGNKLYKAIEEAGVLLAMLDGKTDIDIESEEFARLVSPAMFNGDQGSGSFAGRRRATEEGLGY